MNVSQAVATRIDELLTQNKMRKVDLEHASCLSHDTVKSIMKGKAKGVNLKTILAIADGFGMTAAEFLDSPLFDRDNFDL